MKNLDRQSPEQRARQAEANTAIEGLAVTEKDRRFLAYLDGQEIDDKTRQRLIRDYAEGRFEPPALGE